jgi:hypothetical protein
VFDASDLAALVCATAITIIVGGVILLRPLARRLPDLLERVIEQRSRPAGEKPTAFEARRISAVEARLERLEERVDAPEANTTSALPGAAKP